MEPTIDVVSQPVDFDTLDRTQLFCGLHSGKYPRQNASAFGDRYWTGLWPTLGRKRKSY